MMAQKRSSARIPPRRTTRGRCVGGIRRPLVVSRGGRPLEGAGQPAVGSPAAACCASSFPAPRSSAMGRTTRGVPDKGAPRGRGTGKEPSERVAPPAGADTPCWARRRPIRRSRSQFAPVRPAPVSRVSARLRGRLSIGPPQDRAATASISTPAPSGRAATPKAARAGRVSPVK